VDCYARGYARQPANSVLKVRIADDRVAAVHALGLWPVIFIATDRGTPAVSKFRTAVRRKSCLSMPGHPAFRQAVAPGFATVAASMACVPPRQVREHVRDNTPEASAETMYAVQLLREERLEFRSKVNNSAFRVLG